MLNLARYPSYQLFLAIVASMVLAAVLFPLWIRLLRVRGIGQQVRADGPQGHLVKQGTPTMGGVLILFVITVVFLVMGVPTRGSLLALGVLLSMGLLGFIDDWAKVTHDRSLGLRPRAKLFWQAVISVVFALLLVNWAGGSTLLAIPLTSAAIDLGVWTTTLTIGGVVIAVPWLYLGFMFLLMAGMSNAVNLTDGLDGLAAGSVMIVMLAYAAIAFRQDSLETALLAASTAGACIGFLWYNSFPADIFMGDTGSLGLGGLIAALAAVTNTELLILLIGGVFVAETMSVILQVGSFKLTGRRIFRMAPLHHHFEMLGWSETKVMVRFWIITGIFAGAGFAIYFVQTLGRR